LASSVSSTRHAKGLPLLQKTSIATRMFYNNVREGRESGGSAAPPEML
jgi:hypothetical protein